MPESPASPLFYADSPKLKKSENSLLLGVDTVNFSRRVIGKLRDEPKANHKSNPRKK